MKTVRCYIAALLFLFILPACTEKLEPEDVFASYMEYWQQGRYEQMYELISEKAQSAMTKEQFANRYRSIYEGIEMSNLIVAAPQVGEEKEQASPDIRTFPYQLKMDTAAGPIAADGAVQIVRNEAANNEWKVAWKPSLLFPSMEEGDKVNVRTLKAERGTIYDRFGRELAANGSLEVLGIVPGRLGDARAETIAKLAERLAVPESFIQDKLAASWVKDDVFVPVVNITKERINLDFSDLPGVTKREEGARVYPYGEAAAHLTGYIREVTAEDLDKHPDRRFGPGDMIGKAGMEQIFEERLRGRDGIQITIVKADGQVKETLARVEPVNGEDVRVTIDAMLQDSIYRALDGDAGTGAAIHPRTGEILALVSSPAYDPNRFVQGLSSEQWKVWNEDPKKPLLNRFTKLYAPGSVFKPITAAIGLQLGVSTVDEIKRIDGLRWAKDASWGSYYVTRVRDVPSETLADAIVNSDNIYLAQEALEIGAEPFSTEAEKFGFGKPLPIAYPFPQASLSNNGISNEILLADSSYGQGEVAMSPLHLALAYTPFINEGQLIAPVLELSEGGKAEGKPWGPPVITPATAEKVSGMLLDVVENRKGTGHGAYMDGRRIAGKTGTAELKKSKEEKGQENGWFVAYDAKRADLLLAVMIEDVQQRGGSGYVVRKTAPVLKEYVGGRE